MDDEFGLNDKLEKNGEHRKAETYKDAEKANQSQGKNSDLLQPPDDPMLKHKRVSSDSTSVKSSGSTKSGSSRGAGRGKVDKGMMVGTDILLPQRFVVKYLGYRETTNLWGIKYTRKPVDEMVADAKQTLSTSKGKPGKALPLLKLEVVQDGILVGPMPQNANPNFPSGKFAIQSISYGVQDLVYTRVFAMIVVRADAVAAKKSAADISTSDGSSPFRCHAFVTDTRETAKNLTYALASAFQIFSQSVASGKVQAHKPAKFAIDLRSEEEMQADIDDSEA